MHIIAQINVYLFTCYFILLHKFRIITKKLLSLLYLGVICSKFCVEFIYLLMILVFVSDWLWVLLRLILLELIEWPSDATVWRLMLDLHLLRILHYNLIALSNHLTLELTMPTNILVLWLYKTSIILTLVLIHLIRNTLTSISSARRFAEN
jgi:hypothetical protein